jgi:hypothetical protein
LPSVKASGVPVPFSGGSVAVNVPATRVALNIVIVTEAVVPEPPYPCAGLVSTDWNVIADASLGD